MAESAMAQIAGKQIQQQMGQNAATSASFGNVDSSAVTQYQSALSSPTNSGYIQFETNGSRVSKIENELSRIENELNTKIDRSRGGDVLDALQNIKDKFDNLKSQIQSVISKKDVTQSDLMKMQVLIIEFGYMAELTTKTSDKVSQAAQTLFRNQ